MLRFFYWPAVGPDITEERRKFVEKEEELDPLKSVRLSLRLADYELKGLMEKMHESYRMLIIHAIDTQGHLNEAAQSLRTLEQQNERPL